jgi:hypothetical protein
MAFLPALNTLMTSVSIHLGLLSPSAIIDKAANFDA